MRLGVRGQEGACKGHTGEDGLLLGESRDGGLQAGLLGSCSGSIDSEWRVSTSHVRGGSSSQWSGFGCYETGRTVWERSPGDDGGGQFDDLLGKVLWDCFACTVTEQ